MRKFEVRASCNITFDFIVEAESPEQAEDYVKGYLEYVEGGKPEGQYLGFPKLEDDDECTGIFIMETEIEDCNEI